MKDPSGFRLFKEIVSRSESDTWEEAKKEWSLSFIRFASDEAVVIGKYTCLCGHTHLKELCYIKNEYNLKTELVGNCCIKKFMEDIKSDEIFKAVKKAMKTGKISKVLIDYSHEHDVINDWEHRFFLDVYQKKSKTEKQQAKYESVKAKILSGVCIRV
jgi:hypothetical protein